MADARYFAPAENKNSEGRQVNGLQNPFYKFIGKPIAESLMQIKAEDLLASVPHPKHVRDQQQYQTDLTEFLTNLTVYHRTTSLQAAQIVADGNALYSIGSSSALGGGAVWGQGLYLSLSSELFKYGPIPIRFKINPQAIIGRDFDVFAGGLDGFIIVIKSADALVRIQGELDSDYMPPPGAPLETHIQWITENMQHSRFETINLYLNITIKSIEYTFAPDDNAAARDLRLKAVSNLGPVYFQLLQLILTDRITDDQRRRIDQIRQWQKVSLAYFPLQAVLSELASLIQRDESEQNTMPNAVYFTLKV